MVSGWGTLTSGGSQPEELMEVTVTTMTNTQVETVIDTFNAQHLLQRGKKGAHVVPSTT